MIVLIVAQAVIGENSRVNHPVVVTGMKMMLQLVAMVIVSGLKLEI